MWKTGRRVSIIMVDDDEDDCFVIKEALSESELDHTLTILKSAIFAANHLRGCGKYAGTKPELPDLILLDLFMPGSSGRSVLREIRNDVELSQLDVVVSINSTDWAQLWECYQLGATAVFSKGKRQQTFAEIIRISGPYWFKFVTFRVEDGNRDSNFHHGRL